MTKAFRRVNHDQLVPTDGYTRAFLDAGLTVITGGLASSQYKVFDTHGTFGPKGSILLAIDLVLDNGQNYIHPDDYEEVKAVYERVNDWNREVTPDD